MGNIPDKSLKRMGRSKNGSDSPIRLDKKYSMRLSKTDLALLELQTKM
jgi:hypothetical protein